MSHPTPEQLKQFAAGELADDQFEAVAAHIEHCEQCGIMLRQSGFFPTLTLDESAQGKPELEKVGSLVGPYKLLQQLGEGGMGIVYMAEQEKPVRRVVALKIIKPGMDSDQVIARFEAERQALAMMDHHHIAKVFDAGTTESGRPYFAMELVKGVPITDYCDRNKLSMKQRLEMFIPVCQAIQHAHQKGIIHRDIKPSNVLVTLYDGKPVPTVIDFGIAKATQQKLTERTMFTGIGQILGTFEYMSPEQAEMNQLDIDTRSDVYSLGVMLYELLTGSTPINKHQLNNIGLEEMLRTIRETEPPKPSTRLSDSTEALPSISAVRQTEPAKLSRFVRGDLDWIVMKALEKDRTRRYETANNLALDVERFLKDETIEASPPSNWYRMRKFVRRNKPTLVATIAILGILLTTTTVSTTLAYWALQAEQEAYDNETDASAATAAEQQARREEERLQRIAQDNFEEANREATRSKHVIAFFKQMLNGIRPAAAMGRDTAMLRDILSDMSSRLHEELATQPLVEAELRVTIGDVYEQFWRYSEAEAQYRKALQLYQRHPSSSKNQADVLDRLGKLPDLDNQEALELLQRSLDIRRRELGSGDASVANTIRTMEKRRGHPPESLPKLQEALTILEYAAGDHDLEIIEVLTELSRTRFRAARLGDEPKPEPVAIDQLLDRADSLAKSRQGSEFRRAEALVSDCRSKRLSGLDPRKSLKAAERTVEIVEQLENGDVLAFDYLISLARRQVSVARYREAKSTVDRVLRSAGKYFDGDSRRTAQLHLECSAIIYQLGFWTEARQVQDRALEILGQDRHRDVHPYSHFFDRFDPRVADRLERYRRASWRHALRAEGATSWSTLGRGDMYATALFQQGKHKQGLSILNQVYLKSDRHWQYVTAVNLVANEPHRNVAMFARALEAAEQTGPNKSKYRWLEEDAARAILVDPNLPSDLLQRAVALAEQANRQGRGRGLCLALARYRQGRLDEVQELLQPAMKNLRYRAIALTLAALTAWQQGNQTEATRCIDELGLLSTVRIEMPRRFVLAMRENLFIAFFMQSELQKLTGFPSDATDAKRVDLGLERYARFVARHDDFPKIAGRLARYYAWFRRYHLHEELCERLIKKGAESGSHRDNAYVSMAFLSIPTNNKELCQTTLSMNERAANATDRGLLLDYGDDGPVETSAGHFSQYLLACALSEHRMGNFEDARTWIQRAEPYASGVMRGTCAAIKSMNCVRLGESEEAEAALRIAEEVIWWGPSRDHAEFEILNFALPVEETPPGYYHHHPTGTDRFVNWMLLEEATKMVADASSVDST